MERHGHPRGGPDQRRADIVNSIVWHNVVWRAAVGTALVLSLSVPDAHAASKKSMDSAVTAAQQGNKPIPVVLRTEPGSLEAVKARLAAHRPKITIEAEYASVSALRVTLHPKDLSDILALPGVLGLSSDAAVNGAAASKTSTKTTASTTSTTTSGDDSSATAFSADLAASLQQWSVVTGALGSKWTGLTGSGVGVAVVDSGIDGTLPEFKNRISAFYDFTKGGVATSPTDGYGHGTHVAGLIGASSLTFSGLAPRVHFVGVKVLDAEGRGRTSDVIAALEFLVTNRQALNIQVVNLSLGRPILEPADSDPLVQAVEHAVASGLVVVTSAGNHGQNAATGADGYAGITSPGNAPSAITAGSLDLHGTADRSDDTVSPFSSRGPTWYDGLVKPDLLAPGHGLFSSAAAGSTLAKTSTLSATGQDTKLFGTSMAAATTTGVVALVIEANRRAFPNAGRDLPPHAIKALLQYTTVAVHDPSGTEYDLLTQGAGGLNALGAIGLAKVLDPAAPVGSWWLTSGVAESSKLGGTLHSWTRRIIWGDTLLSGQGIYTNAPAWQTNLVWGSTLVWGETLIWGDALVWGDIFVWGENVVTSTALIWGEALVWGEGLVVLEGQTLIWGDALIWGEALIWGDALVWGESTPTP